MHRPPLGLVVAMSRNRVIGKDGGLPWHLPEDLRHFREVTMGHAIIMGRATHVSIGRALPGRRNIVLTRDRSARYEGCEVVHTLEEAVALARTEDSLPMVIGGAAVFRESLPLVTRMYITEVNRDVDGDTFFPEIPHADFDEVERRRGQEPDLSFVVLERAEDTI